MIYLTYNMMVITSFCFIHPFLGLAAQYYDACIGWGVTVERIHSATFTMPFLQAPKAYLYTKHGQSFDHTDFRNKTIGW